jgi:hypothetical protein
LSADTIEAQWKVIGKAEQQNTVWPSVIYWY